MKYKKTIISLVVIAGLLAVKPSSSERVGQLQAELNTTNELDVFGRYTIYKELSEYKAYKAQYSSKLEEYSKWYEHEKNCFHLARSKHTGNETYFNSKWYSKTQLLMTFTVSQNNFEYVCTIQNNLETLEIFQNDLK